MGNNISTDSYLNTSPCGGRNITWSYLHSNGTFPSLISSADGRNRNTPFENCTNIARVLHSHCCEDGVCRPSPIDHEFVRYEWNDWNGLGYPYVEGDGKVLVGARGKDGKKCQPPLLKRDLETWGRMEDRYLERMVGGRNGSVYGTLERMITGGKVDVDKAGMVLCAILVGVSMLALVGWVLWRVLMRNAGCIGSGYEREVEKGGKTRENDEDGV
jgi:hypothetical protein